MSQTPPDDDNLRRQAPPSSPNPPGAWEPQPGAAAYAPMAQPTPGQAAQGLQMKRRNPFAAWLLLPFITLGIYHFVWYYKIHHEMALFDPRRRVPVVGPVLVILFLFWTVIAPIVSYFNTGRRIADTQRSAGLQPTCSGLLGVLLMFVLGLGILYYQMELNRVHDVYGPSVRPGQPVPLQV